jgi:hypothetical protein
MTTATYAINTATGGISTYAGAIYEASLGLAVLNNNLYCVTPAGLYKATGDDDNGTDIDAYLDTGMPAFGEPERLKYCTEARIDGLASGGMMVTTFSDEAGTRRERAYTPPKQDATVARDQRVRFGRGPRALRWGLRVANRNGGTLTVKSIALALLPGRKEA